MKASSLKSRAGSLVCPLCGGHKLGAHGQDSARCESCGGIVSGPTLEVLRQIADLPDVVGRHACECGHPEMRLLPDGTHHCPACGSEVGPLDVRAIPKQPEEHDRAWWAGWMDGRFGELGSFVDNRNLGRWEAPSERLEYYRGHRVGSEARRTGVIPCSCKQGRWSREPSQGLGLLDLAWGDVLASLVGGTGRES